MTKRAWSAFRLLGLVVATSGCVAPIEDPAAQDIAEHRVEIVGGAEEWGFPLVGMLAGMAGPGAYYPFCTASPVTPTVLITAAHCADAFTDVDGTIVYARLAPDGSGPTHVIDVGSRTTHPQWSMYDPVRYVNDIALVRLNEPINDTDIFPELHSTAETAGDRGVPLKVVGFGVSNPPDQGSGTKRSIDMSVNDIMNQYFTMALGDSWRGVCYGDSGGPSFVLGEHRDSQWGVHARTQVESCGPAEDTSVGYFFNSFVRPTVLALDPTAEDCGDGICTGLENESSCAADCSPFQCGDGAVEGPEACDDGNTVGGDGCSADCLSNETCGNGIADSAVGELCDDGNTVGGDGCSANCLSNETCGNGVTDGAAGEQCDDGNTADGDGCSADCLSNETCGNGVIDSAAGEVCDDGNTTDGDGCSANCGSDESCGNGVLDSAVGEICDDGNAESGDGCSGDCAVAEGCGNGTLEAAFGELCDDGNTVDGDGCSANCRSDESCGNGVIDLSTGETCDDGNLLDGDSCPSDCGRPEHADVSLTGMVGGCYCDVGAGRPRRSASLFHLLSVW